MYHHLPAPLHCLRLEKDFCGVEQAPAAVCIFIFVGIAAVPAQVGVGDASAPDDAKLSADQRIDYSEYPLPNRRFGHLVKEVTYHRRQILVEGRQLSQ